VPRGYQPSTPSPSGGGQSSPPPTATECPPTTP
jgi:hypothetical protein